MKLAKTNIPVELYQQIKIYHDHNNMKLYKFYHEAIVFILNDILLPNAGRNFFLPAWTRGKELNVYLNADLMNLVDTQVEKYRISKSAFIFTGLVKYCESLEIYELK